MPRLDARGHSPIGWRHAGACDFAIDPSLPAHEVDVFWHPDIDPRVVRLLKGGDLRSSDSLHRPNPTVIREGPDGHHLMFGSSADPVLALAPALDELNGPVAAILPLDQHAPRRIDATLRLWRCLSGKLPGQSRDHLTPNRRQRLTMMLRALDARTEGADRREIAQALFGDEAVPPGVVFDDHHLRSRIARLLREGAAIVAGGYRRLLGDRSRPDGS